jgi:hypothetical protein
MMSLSPDLARTMVIDVLEDVRLAEQELEYARQKRDNTFREVHPTLSYNEIARLSNPETNGGYDTSRLSRGRIIQIIQPHRRDK